MKNTNCLKLPLALLALAMATSSTGAQSTYEQYTFTTLAGGGGFITPDGTGGAERLWGPSGVAVDTNGNVYVGDQFNCTIRKVTPAGEVTTLAGLTGSSGSADGTGSDARFNAPWGVAVDSAGNVYVADFDNNTIRKVTPAGVVTTLAGLAGSSGSADGTGSDARFNRPLHVAVDSTGNVYVADHRNNTIRKVTPARKVTTLASGFNGPSGVAVDTNGNVYVADEGNNRIGKVTPAGVVTTLASGFNSPVDVTVDDAGNVYVADLGNYTIRKVTPAGVVTTLAGRVGSSGSADGTGSAARFNSLGAVAVDSAGNVYVADIGNNTIQKVTPIGTNWVVTTLAGLAGNYGGADQTGVDARFRGPAGVAVDTNGNVYVADQVNATIRKVTSAEVVTTLAGLAGSVGNANGTGNAARFNNPTSVAVDSAGNVYVADFLNFAIRQVTPAGVVATLAGLVPSFPTGVAVDINGNVYVADAGDSTILKRTPAGVVTTLAGLAGADPGSVDGTGSAARFNVPYGVAVDNAGNVYVTDIGNHNLRKVTPAGVVTTVAGLAGFAGSADGTGSTARFYAPRGVAVDSAGNVYVADTFNNTIRKVMPVGTNWVVTTLAGKAGIYGSSDGTGSAVRFDSPTGVAVDSAGNIYVADFYLSTIRKGSPALAITSSGPNFGFNAGQFGFDLSGPLGQLVVVEASTDLVRWLPLWTNTFAGSLHFSDPQSGVYSNRFYRARTP
jgi:streptogramin lyase